MNYRLESVYVIVFKELLLLMWVNNKRLQ